MNFSCRRVVMACLITLVSSPPLFAQTNIISAEQVQKLITSGGKVVLVDVRTADEYQQGHIPGAIHIPADRISAEKAKLPKDRSMSLIFYCRGAG